MIAVDTNILVYAHRAENPLHEMARSCLASLAQGRNAWALPWPCVHEFYSVVTHRRVFSIPTPRSAALDQIDAWMSSPTAVLLTEGAGHWPTLRGLIDAAQIVGPMVHDTRIAAICLEHGVREFWSADRDFNRFPSLPVRNPLVG